MEGQLLFSRQRPRLPRGRAPTRGFLEASAGFRPPARSPRSAAQRGSRSAPTGGRGLTPPRGRAASPRRCRRPPSGAPGLRLSRRLVRRGRRGPGGRWKGQGVKARLKVEPNFAAGDGDACASGAGCGADSAALGGLPGGGAPPRPPRQWQPHDRAHQRIIAARDISADTIPARVRGGGGGRQASTAVGRVDLPALALRPPPLRRLPFPGRVPPAPWRRSATLASRPDRARAPSRTGIPQPSESAMP